MLRVAMDLHLTSGEGSTGAYAAAKVTIRNMCGWRKLDIDIVL